jgi:Tfp pilus assembly protein PilW
MRNRGWTAVELLVGMVITSLMLIAMYFLFMAQYNVQSVTYDVTASARDARNPLDMIGDHVRMAAMCDSTQGCVGTNNSVIDAASANALTYYTSAAGAKAQYHLSGTTLVRTVGVVNTNALVNVTSLALTYYKSSTYNNANLTTTTTANAPTAAELPLLSAIRITASTTTNGRSIHYSTLVRLRNSPKKTNLKGN